MILTYHDVFRVIKDLGVATIDDIRSHLVDVPEDAKSRRNILQRIRYLERRGEIRSMRRKHMIPHQGAMRGAWIKYVEVTDD